MVNLLSVDVNRIMELFMYSYCTWIALVQLILSFYLLWQQLGMATLIGIGLLLLMLLLNAGSMSFLQRFEIIKLYAWEYAFAAQVTEIRKSELRDLLRIIICWACAQLFWNMTPFVILLSTFTVYTRGVLFPLSTSVPTNGSEVIPNRPSFLNAERIFVSVSLFNLLREPLVALPWNENAAVIQFRDAAFSWTDTGPLVLSK
ncbi:unnamed protein product [Echinostoma caproni]|uniref:ABC transmembrane type-1 domain-containing protein n=1 Tax=Echinostoma caproni TaxID=27848 RepID=A0A3P8GKZ7_9TREM|nr:unnamed protein product [Echinostoma caproni]